MQFEANTTDTFVQQLRFDRLMAQGVRYAFTRGGPFGNQVITANAFVRTRPELDTPNMQLFFAPVSFTTRVWFPGIRPAEKVGLGGSVCLLRPESRGHVTLRSANPTDPPKVTLNFLKERADREAMRDGMRMLRKVYNTKPLADMISSRSHSWLQRHLRRGSRRLHPQDGGGVPPSGRHVQHGHQRSFRGRSGTARPRA